MDDQLRILAMEAFRQIHPKSPLRGLKNPDKRLLFAMLLAYATISNTPGINQPETDRLETLHKAIQDAGKFGELLKSELYQGPYSDDLLPDSAAYIDLPERLIELSRKLGSQLSKLGKRGHKGRNLVNQRLLTASEFVRLKLGEHHDEHLAQLLIIVGGKHYATKDIDGDSIRKRRTNAKATNPELHAQTLEGAKKASDSTVGKP